MAVKRPLAFVRRSKVREDYITGSVSFSDTYIGELTHQGNARLLFQLDRPDLARYQPHPNYTDCRATYFEADQRKHSQIYDVTVGYSNQLSESESPYDEPATVSVETVSETIPFTHDYEGNPNTNTAGDLIEEAEDEDLMLVFRLTKKISPSYPAWLLDYGLAINSDPVTFKGRTLAPKTLKIAKLRIGDEELQDDTPFLPLSIEIVYNSQTWEKQFLNRGLREMRIIKRPKVGGDFEYVLAKVPILDDQDKPISTPAFLDSDGRRPRVDSRGNIVTLADELDKIRANQDPSLRLKEPLDPEDIIVLKRSRRRPKPFNGVLPLT